MFTIVLYATLCMSGIDECYAQEPLSWTTDASTLAATAGICQDLAAELISDDGPNTVDAECHVIQADERDTHDAGGPHPYEQDTHAAQKAKN